MPPSQARLDLMNVCDDAAHLCEISYNTFCDPSKSDAEALQAIKDCGAACVNLQSQVPAFIGSYGIYMANAVNQSLYGINDMNQDVTIVAPGEFKFTGPENWVGIAGPYDRMMGIKAKIQQYAAQIDAQEANLAASGTPYYAGPGGFRELILQANDGTSLP